MYRGDKDLRIGKILCRRFGHEYLVALPGVSSPGDQILLGKKRPDIKSMEPFPEGFRVVQMRSILIYARKRNISLGGFFQFSPGYIDLIKKVNPDIIFECAYTTMTPRMYMTAIGSKLNGIPRAYLDVGDIPRVGHAKQLLKKPESLMTRDAQLAITYNDLGKERILKDYGMPADRIHVIPKPVDTSKFSPAVDGHEIRRRFGLGDSFVVSYFGRLDLNKGSDVLARVARSVRHDPRFRRTIFLFVGGHLSASHAHTIGPIIKDCAPGQVVMTGYVDHSDMPAFQAASDVAVFPDVTNLPGFSQVLAESMSAGKSIVIGNRGYEGATPLRDVKNGLIVTPRSEEEIRNALLFLMENESERRRLGAEVRAFAVDRMDWERVAAQYNSLLLKAAR